MGNKQSNESTFNKQLNFLIGSLSDKTEVEKKLFNLSQLFLEKNFPLISTERTCQPRYSESACPYIHSISSDVADDMGGGKLTSMQASYQHCDGDVVYADVYRLFTPLQFNRTLFTAQTFVQWKSAYDIEKLYLLCQKAKKTIYIQPIDDFPDFVYKFSLNICSGRTDFFGLLSHFCQVFFNGIHVTILPKIDTCQKKWRITERFHSKTNKKQLLVTDFDTKLQSILPADGHCILGIIWTDLYPSQDLNFVLGQAFYQHKSGIFSFGRFEPKNFDAAVNKDISDVDSSLIWKILKVISHETCHLFGLGHCEFFSCLMNESSSVPEALSQPLFLCPVCLHKLQKICQFDVVGRYAGMLDLLREIHSQLPDEKFSQSMVWLEACLNFLRADSSAES